MPETMIKHNTTIISKGTQNILVDNSNGRIATTTSTSTKKVAALRVNVAEIIIWSATCTWTEIAGPKSDLRDGIFRTDSDLFNMKF